MKIVFFGSDDFAATSLEKLIRERYEVVAVVTPPDRARDRMKVTFLPVKMITIEHQIPIFQPDELSDPDFQQQLASFDADLFVVIAYGKFLPTEILEMPKHFCVNVHASLLPKYRGAAPINWAIINGEERTGVTLIKMNERMDAGDMILQEAMDISADIDALTLREGLADLGAQTLIRFVKELENGKPNLIPQDEKAVTFASKLTPDLEVIDWTKSVWDVYNLIRGLAPKPAAYTMFQGKRLKILEASVFSEEVSGIQAGSVVQLVREGMVVACGQGQLLLKRVHLESSKPMDARSFSVGHQVAVGDIFQIEK